MRFAVCEDNGADRLQLCDQLEACASRHGIEAQICPFSSAASLLEAVEDAPFSGFFLDILMPGMSGMELALRLRREGNHRPIVFISITKDYLAQSHSVWASHYLLKPIEDRELDEAMERVLRRLEMKEKTLDLENGREKKEISYGDIYYVKGAWHGCVLCTGHGKEQLPLSMGKVTQGLEDERFFRCHRSFVVNLDHVLSVEDNRLQMRDGGSLPVRRGEAEKVRNAWADRRFALARGRD